MTEVTNKRNGSKKGFTPWLVAALAVSMMHVNTVRAGASKTPKKGDVMESKVINRYSPETLRISTMRDFAFPAEQVWGLIAGFDTLPDYHASIVHSELKQGGVVRHITMSDDAGGGIVVERQVFFDDVDRIFSYRITDLIDCEMAFRNYQAWVHVESIGPETCRVHWGSNFDVEGATDEETDELARVIYKGCFDGIQNTLEARK